MRPQTDANQRRLQDHARMLSLKFGHRLGWWWKDGDAWVSECNQCRMYVRVTADGEPTITGETISEPCDEIAKEDRSGQD